MRTFKGARRTGIRKRLPLRKKAVVAKALLKYRRNNVARICKKVISSMAERKVSVWTSQRSMGSYNFTQFSTENILDINRNVLSPIAQGVDQAGRIGNKIKTKSCIIRGVLCPYQANSTQSGQWLPPMEVKMWILSYKPNPNSASLTDITTMCGNEIFQLGGINQGMTTTLTDIVAPINSNVVNCYYQRTFKLGTAQASNNLNSVNSFQYGNNDFKLNHKFRINLTKYMPKNVNYDDTFSNPYNRKIFIVFESVYANGISQPANTTTPSVDLWFSVEYKYTDM